MKALDRLPGEGLQLRLLAIAHTLAGIAFYRRELRSIGRAGVFAAVPYRGDRSTAFWFLVPSPLVWVIGRLVSDAEEAGDWPAVRRAHRVSLVSAVIAILCLPGSGFWGWLAISARGLQRPGSRAIRRAHRT
jgi:Family of unknown function (DUF6463)